MDKLHWFKFSPSSWMMGRIQRCSEIAQGRFIRLCCSYWNHGCEMLLEDAKIDLGEDVFEELFKSRVIYTEDENVYIRFLDDQYLDVEKTSSKGKLYALKRWKPEEYNKIMGTDTEKEPNSSLMGTHKNPNADKIRKEEIRKEESNKDSFSFSNSLKNEGVESQIVSEYLQVRRNKKAVNTKTAFNALMSKIKKTKYSVPQAIKICVENSWIGFSADWVKDTEEKKYNPNTADVVTIKTWGK